MKLYFTLAQIPELANLPARQRRLVHWTAYNQFCHEKRWSDIVRLSRPLIFLGTPLLLEVVLRPLGVRYPLLVAVAIGVGLGIVYSCALFFERLRPYYRKYLSEHPNEFGQTAQQA